MYSRCQSALLPLLLLLEAINFDGYYAELAIGVVEGLVMEGLAELGAAVQELTVEPQADPGGPACEVSTARHQQWQRGVARTYPPPHDMVSSTRIK
jgi:hypothetical protein